MTLSPTITRYASKSILLAFALSMAACSSAPQKPDNQQVVEQRKPKGPTRDEQLGLANGSLEAFEGAVAELKKEKPDNQVALDLLKKAVKLSPDFAEAQYNLGLLQLQLGEAKEAVQALERAREIDPNPPEYAVALGHAYAQVERYDDAHRLFEEVVASEPENLAAKNNLAVLELQRGNNDKAIEILQEILRLDEKNVAALNTMGRVYRQKGNLSLAKYVFEEKALKVDPDNADLHNNLGLVYLDLKDVPNAVKHFEKATESNPNHFEAQINLGTILLEYLDYKRAGEAFAEAVRIAPNNCVGRLGDAASKFALGNGEAAVEAYRYYVDNCNDAHVAAHEHLAKLYQSVVSDNAKALAEYQKLVEIAKDEKSKKNYAAMAGFLESQLKKAEQKKSEAPEKTEEPGAAAEGDAAATEGKSQPSESQEQQGEGGHSPQGSESSEEGESTATSSDAPSETPEKSEGSATADATQDGG